MKPLAMSDINSFTEKFDILEDFLSDLFKSKDWVTITRIRKKLGYPMGSLFKTLENWGWLNKVEPDVYVNQYGGKVGGYALTPKGFESGGLQVGYGSSLKKSIGLENYSTNSKKYLDFFKHMTLQEIVLKSDNLGVVWSKPAVTEMLINLATKTHLVRSIELNISKTMIKRGKIEQKLIHLNKSLRVLRHLEEKRTL